MQFKRGMRWRWNTRHRHYVVLKFCMYQSWYSEVGWVVTSAMGVLHILMTIFTPASGNLTQVLRIIAALCWLSFSLRIGKFLKIRNELVKKCRVKHSKPGFLYSVAVYNSVYKALRKDYFKSTGP